MSVRRILKWSGLALLALFGLVLLAVLAIHINMGRDIAATFAVDGERIAVPSNAASIEEGRRQAQLRGCFQGCHGRAAEGAVMIRLFDGTRVVAPDLGHIAARYSVEELERAIRRGVKPDGTSVLRIMPSEMLSTLSDEDLGMIIAWLRTQPDHSDELPDSRYGPVARIMGFVFKRQFGTVLAAEAIAQEQLASHRMSASISRGRYLAETVCRECHGNDLHGAPDGSTSSLSIVTALSRDDFDTLMHEGVAMGGRELGLMAAVSRSRFTHFTEGEISALYNYLNSVDSWFD
jgi:cytochrome c553